MIDPIPREHPQRWDLGAVWLWLRWHRGIDGLHLRTENWTDEDRAAARYALTVAEVAGLSDPDGAATMIANSPVPDLTLATAAVYLLAIELGATTDWANVAVELATPTSADTVQALEFGKASAEVVNLVAGLWLLLTSPVENVDVSVNQRVTALTTPCTIHTLAACYALAKLHQQHPSHLATLREAFGDRPSEGGALPVDIDNDPQNWLGLYMKFHVSMFVAPDGTPLTGAALDHMVRLAVGGCERDIRRALGKRFGGRAAS